MKDRQIQYPHRYQLVVVAGQPGVYDLVAVPGTITEAGTPLNKANLLSDATVTKLGLVAPDDNVNGALSKLCDKLASSPIASYLAFCANVNANSLDGAFGKNNESALVNIGRQLAMFAWFMGSSKTTYPFTNLQTKATVADIVASSAAYLECAANTPITKIINVSPWAHSIFKAKFPLPPGTIYGTVVAALPLYTGDRIKFTAGVDYSIGTMVCPYAGRYTLSIRTGHDLNSGCYAKVLVNSVLVHTSTYINNTNGHYELDINLQANDSIEIKVYGSASDYTYGRCAFLIADRPCAFPGAINQGTVPIWISDTAYSYRSNSVVYTNSFYAPIAGTYRVYVAGYDCDYSISGENLAIFKNGANYSPASYVLNDSCGRYQDIVLAVGDSICVRVAGYSTTGSSSSTCCVMAVCLTSNLNTFPY